jgi:hypothetical protein
MDTETVINPTWREMPDGDLIWLAANTKDPAAAIEQEIELTFRDVKDAVRKRMERERELEQARREREEVN